MSQERICPKCKTLPHKWLAAADDNRRWVAVCKCVPTSCFATGMVDLADAVDVWNEECESRSREVKRAHGQHKQVLQEVNEWRHGAQDAVAKGGAANLEELRNILKVLWE